jgi:hypothetical protein
MIDVRVLTVKPHPSQATNNPGCWAVQLHVSHAGHSRTFWRWHTVQKLDERCCHVTPSNDKEPSHNEILARFWDNTFGEIHGFDFHEA